MIENHMKRYKQALRDGEDTRKLDAIIAGLSREEFTGWTDEIGLDAMHYAIMAKHAEAVDLLLKMGYFVRPYQPQFSLYTHFAAHLGYRTCLNVLLTHRPDDFCIAKQPLIVPPSALVDVLNDVKPLTAIGNAVVSTPFSQTGVKPPSTINNSQTGKKGNENAARSSVTSAPSSRPPSRSTSRPTSAKKDRAADTASKSLGAGERAIKTTNRVRVDSSAPPTDPFHLSHKESYEGGLRDFTSDTAYRRTSTVDGERKADPADNYVGDKTQPLLKTPLEVAASACHLDCVKLILDLCVLKANPDAPSKGYLTLAALADCPASMKLLLQTQETKGNDRKDRKQESQRVEDFKAAVEIGVQRARPQCLDLLLADKSVDVKGLFKNINFFHVLYTFSATYGKGAYGRLPEATRVLINRGHDIQAKIPPRTYPLYTLITHSFCFHDYIFTEYYIECMKLLLENGADPNFDEVRFERQILEKKGIKFAAGRNAYSSALHCLLETVETYVSNMASPALAVKFVEDCSELLVRHSADVGKVGRVGDARSDLQGNILHQYAKSSVILGVGKSILRSIMRYGAEPGVKINGKYAINVYFDVLFEALMMLVVLDTNHKFEKDSRTMLDALCDHMSPAEVKDACNIFHLAHGKVTSDQVKPYVRMVSAELKRRSKIVRSLRGLTAWRVWKLCGKRSEAVRNLPVSVELKTLILPLM